MVRDNERLSGRVGASLPISVLNDTFDEKHLNQNLYWSINRLYTRALDGQRGLCHLLRYNGKFSEFKRSQKINTEFDLPYNTYTLKLPMNVINFFNVKAVKEINYTLRNQADFWRNGTDDDRERNAKRKIQDSTWRCGDKKYTNIMSNGSEVNPMHTPDYRYDTNYRYIVRDICTKGGARYKINKASFPYLYSIQETYGRPDLFTHHFAVFINGYLHADAKFFCDNGYIYVFICTNNPSNDSYKNDLIDEDIIREWIKEDVPFTIMGFPFSTTVGYIGRGSNENLVSEDGINYNAFGETLTPKMQFKNNMWLLGYSDPDISTYFLKPTISTLSQVEDDSIRLNSIIDSGLTEKISGMTRVYMEAFNLKNIGGTANLDKTREFQIPLYTKGKLHNPVPPQNVLLFSYDENKEMTFVHSAVIKLYYPNVYQITNIPDDVSLYAIWFVSEESGDHTVFDNPLKNYMGYDPYYAFHLLRNTLPKAVTEYVPAAVTYDYNDYAIFRRSAKSDHNEYMIEKISDIMKDNPERYEYIYTSLMEKTAIKLHANPKQVVYLKDFDLESMTVYDNADACTMNEVPVKFQIPYVGFRIDHHKNTTYRYAIWIDGVLRDVPHIYDTAFTTWFYIPKEDIYNATTLEVEMMRVTGRGRIQAEISFDDVDTSVEIPKIFPDISPQSIMVSIKKVITADMIANDVNKSYVKYMSDDKDYIEKDTEDPDAIIVYRVAPDYEMSWILFGYNRYINGEMVPELSGIFHKDTVIEYPYFDENGQPQVIYVDRTKCKHSALDDTYSRPEHLDWTTGSTIMTEVKDDIREAYELAYPRKTAPLTLSKITPEIIELYKELYPRQLGTEDGVLEESDREWNDRILKTIIEEEPYVYTETQEEYEARLQEYMNRASDNSIVMPLNVAINRDYYKTSDNMFYATTFESKWPNGFYAVDRRRFYQYLPYGKDSDTMYITPIGKPTKADLVETIARYGHNGDTRVVYQWESGGPIVDDDIVYYNPALKKWFSINDYRDNEFTDTFDISEFKIAVAASSVTNPERSVNLDVIPSGRDVTEVVIANMPDIIDSSGIYITAAIHSYYNESEEYVNRIEFIPHYNPDVLSDSKVTSLYTLSEYQIIPGSRLRIMDSVSEYGDYVYTTYDVDGTSYTATASVDTVENLEALKTSKEYHDVIDWDSNVREFKKYYPNPDVYVDDTQSRSFFEHREAIIQNTDFYYRKHYLLDYEKSMTITTENFYDDPSFHKFRITINGRRVDHGTDYFTDIDIVDSYMRGCPIEITFNERSSTVNSAISATYDVLPHVYGKLVGIMTFYEMISYDEETSHYEFSTDRIAPTQNVIYHNVYNDNKPFVWNGTQFEEWDITTNMGIKLKANVDFEFLPYKDRVVWKSRALTTNIMSISMIELERPLSFAYYDFYLGGIKLTPDQLKIVSARRFKIAQGISYYGKHLTIYERCHDQDLYGNSGYMPSTLDDLIASRDKAYQMYLYGTK